MRKLLLISLILVLLSGCSVRWSHSYVSNGNTYPYTWVCGPVYYKINPWNTNSTQITEILSVASDASRLFHRPIIFAGYTNESRRVNGQARGKILIEHYWPSDAPWGFGWTGHTISGTRYVGANIYLNSPPQIHRYVFMHELGHALGLDHVSDPEEIMDPNRIWQNKQWGRGTTVGLAALGKFGC